MNTDLFIVIENLFSTNTCPYPIQLVQQIGLDEGLRQTAYQDEYGNWTIGFGHTPATPGEHWSLTECYNELIKNIGDRGWDPVDQNIPWADELGIVRKSVLVNMAYNMGIGQLLAFDETLTNMRAGNILGTLQGMKDSDWYNEVTTRAQQLMYQYYTNKWMITPLNSKQDSLLYQFMNAA
jgi:lysozyme